MAKRRTLYTDLQFGTNISNAISLRINYKKPQAPKTLYIKLQRKGSDDLIASFCVPGHISPGVKVFPDGLIDYSGEECFIIIEGLTEMSCNDSDISQKVYESRTCCSTLLKANVSKKKGSKLNLTLTNGRFEDLEVSQATVSKKKTISVSVNHEQNSAYVVMSPAKSTFPSPQTFFTELCYNGRRIIFIQSSSRLFYRIPIRLLPTNVDPTLKVYVVNQYQKFGDHVEVWQILKTSESLRFKTHLTTSELRALQFKSLVFALTGEIFRVPILFLWRTKPTPYWDTVRLSNNVMKPYRKDFNGDPRSIINGNIDGLFFSVSVNTSTMQPSTLSWFGNKRMYIRLDALILPGFNFFFADFYCHYRVHYVTLVITRPGSKADVFCKAQLPRIDSADNLFLSRPNVFGPWYALASKHLQVEVLYTEAINVSEMCRRGLGYFENVIPQGRGHSKPEGIPKNRTCTLCNI